MCVRRDLYFIVDLHVAIRQDTARETIATEGEAYSNNLRRVGHAREPLLRERRVPGRVHMRWVWHWGHP